MKRKCCVLGIVMALLMTVPVHSHAAKYVCRIAMGDSSSSPAAIAARWMKHEVERLSNGDIEIKIFPDGILGGEVKTIQELQIGSLQACFQTDHSVSHTGARNSMIFTLPYVVDSPWAAHKLYDSDWVREHIYKPLEEKGVLYNGMMCNGFRGFHISKKMIIHSPEDVKGLKMRVSESPEYVKLMKAWGVIPTPISWAEIYTALSQKIVDGTDTMMYYNVTQKLYEVVPYVSLTNHQCHGHGFWYNKQWIQSLPPKYSKLMVDMGWKMIDWLRQYQETADVQYEDTLRKAGATVYHLTDDEKAEFKKLVKDIPLEYEKTFGKALVQDFLKLAERYNKAYKEKMKPDKWGVRDLPDIR